jgi:Flp pilus assembly protein TadD
VGEQAMADRYTYVPIIGLFIMVAWTVAELAARWRYRRLVLATSMATLLLTLGICARLQLSHWQNSIALFSHTLDVTAKNHLAHNNLGVALARQGNLKEAVDHYSKALQAKPEYADAHNNLGVALARQGNLKEAVNHFSTAVQMKPDHEHARWNLERGLRLMGKSARGSNTVVRP